MGAGPWSEHEDQLLRHEYTKECRRHGASNIGWDSIARALPGRSNRDVRKRWINVLQGSLNKGTWTKAEDDRLRSAVGLYDTSWVAVAETVGTRSADQCSKRWNQHLDPALVHTQWTDEENHMLFRAVAAHGSNWSIIQRLHFPRRPSNGIKNQHTLVSRNPERLHKILSSVADAPSCCAPPTPVHTDKSPSVCTSEPNSSTMDWKSLTMIDSNSPLAGSMSGAMHETTVQPSTNMSHMGGLFPTSEAVDGSFNTTFDSGPSTHQVPRTPSHMSQYYYDNNTTSDHRHMSQPFLTGRAIETFSERPNTSLEHYLTPQDLLVADENAKTANSDQTRSSASSRNEVCFIVQDPTEPLIINLIQQLVSARANFRVVRSSDR